MSNIVNRQLREFKKEIIQEIVPIIKQYQEEQRKLSIRVVGVSAENQDSSY
jgi:predicted HTH domain antitoxin